MELPTFENELREALFIQGEEETINECGMPMTDSTPLDLKARVYQRVSKLKESRAIKDLEKDLKKLAEGNYDGSWRIEDILRGINLKQLCDVREEVNYGTAVMKKKKA